MSFRQKVNRRDAWVAFCQAHAKETEALCLPEVVFVSEQHFLDFLTDGSLPGVSPSLGEMPDETFLRLEVVVNSWLPDGWHQMECMAFARERLRRFGRYG